MNVLYFIGFDVHKKSISYCVKAPDGAIVEEGRLRATRQALREWAGKRKEPGFTLCQSCHGSRLCRSAA